MDRRPIIHTLSTFNRLKNQNKYNVKKKVEYRTFKDLPN